MLGSSAQRASIAAACAVIAIFAVVTWIQVSYWRNSRTLFTHATEVTQGNFMAHQNLGNVLEAEQNLDGALGYTESLPKNARAMRILRSMKISLPS